MALPSSIDGVTGSENADKLWIKHYMDVLDCVSSDGFNIGLAIWLDEM